MYRENFCLGFDQNIGNLFFDAGRVKPYRSFSQRKDEPLDAFFETIVFDPQNDSEIRNFFDHIQTKYQRFTPNFNKSCEEVEKRMKTVVQFLINEVQGFFGANNPRVVHEKCEKSIRRIKEETRRNIVYLGQMKGCGVCRHRSILFKAICDLLRIPCRILRGWVNFQGQRVAQVWNQVNINGSLMGVDTMNFDNIPPDSVMTNHYQALSQNFRRSQRETIERLKSEYNRKRGDVISSDHLGVTYRIRDCEVIQNYQDEEQYDTMNADLSVREINVTRLERRRAQKSVSDQIKREIETSRLLRHPNIMEIIGHFVTKKTNTQETIIHTVTKKYDFNVDTYLERLKSRGFRMTEKQRSIESIILMLEIARGIQHIHSFGFVHCDINPTGILLNWDQRAKKITEVRISSFGCIQNPCFMKSKVSIVTNREYASPEYLEEVEKSSRRNIVTPRRICERNDVYSFGVLMSKFRDFCEDYPRLLDLTEMCRNVDRNERPSMWEIVCKLKSILNVYVVEYQERREDLLISIQEENDRLDQENRVMKCEIEDLKRRLRESKV